MLASLSAASFPRMPVWDLTCRILTSLPRSSWSSLYATRSLTATSLFALPFPPLGTVLLGPAHSVLNASTVCGVGKKPR